MPDMYIFPFFDRLSHGCIPPTANICRCLFLLVSILSGEHTDYGSCHSYQLGIDEFENLQFTHQ